MSGGTLREDDSFRDNGALPPKETQDAFAVFGTLFALHDSLTYDGTLEQNDSLTYDGALDKADSLIESRHARS